MASPSSADSDLCVDGRLGDTVWLFDRVFRSPFVPDPVEVDEFV